MVKVATSAPANQEGDYCNYEGKEKWWTADRKGEGVSRFAKTGVASEKECPERTLVEIFELAVKNNGNKVAMRTENMGPLAKGEKPPPALPLKDWKTWTYAQYYTQARDLAKAYIASGLEQHDAVSVFGFNAPEWSISLVAAIIAGGKGSGIYPSDNADQVRYKTDHSNTIVAVVEDAAKLNMYKSIADDLPMLKVIVTWACVPGDDITTSDGRTIKTYSFSDFIKFGAEQSDEALNARIALIKPQHPCVLVYTSGTTGNPKAVMLSHDNVVFSMMSVLSEAGVTGFKKQEERYVSYLPLSHVAGMCVDVFSPISVSSNIGDFIGWASVSFARPYDLKIGTLVHRLVAVKPTIFLGVPRVWEKMMEKLQAVGASSKGLKKALGAFAKKRALKYTSSRQLGGKGVTPTSFSIAKVLLNKIKQKLGLDKCKFMFSGAAPMTRECLEYFGALGININEVYGMSETTGVATWSTDKHHVWGSIGFEVRGAEVRVLDVATGDEKPRTKDLFSPAEDEQGELCFRGRQIMVGYMANERLGDKHVAEIEEKNADTLDAKGWLHSGDKGTRDERGMYKITGRYKELIIGAGGENIAPVPIEDEVKRLCPLVSNVMMVGNKRKFNVMVITLKAVGSTGELPGGNILDGPAAAFSTAKTISEAMSDDAIIKAIEAAIKETNANPAVVPSSAAKVQKFTILPRDFSVVTGELTATLKLKRSVVEEVFDPIISKMYTTKTAYVDYNTAPTADLPMGPNAEPVFEKGLSFNMGSAMKEIEAEEGDAGEDAKAE